MITCPRCGGQAPDGTPWCPYCGYGKPPEPIQQPQPVKPTPPAKKKNGSPVVGCLVILVIIISVYTIIAMLKPDKKANPTDTPTIAITNTEHPTSTLAITRTPYPTATERPESCNIKGNRNTKIYHCKNSPNYDTTDDFIMWFCSPAEAEAAGYRPAATMGGRCEQ